MHPIPDPTTLPVPAPDGRELAVTGGLSGMSLFGSFLAMAQQFPAQGGIAVAGIVGSVLIQVVRMTTDNRIAKLTSDLLHAQASARAADDREARHLARIDSLVRQLDAAQVARDRLSSALLAHSDALSPDARQAIVDAARPIAGGAPGTGEHEAIPTAIVEPDDAPDAIA